MEKLVKRAEFAKLIGKSTVTLWRYQRDGEIPQPKMVNGRTLGWRPEVIEKWLDENPEQRD